MRDYCLRCVLKHLGQAMILMIEAQMGYPHHKIYAIAHMAEAEAESLTMDITIALRIRELRKSYEDGYTVFLKPMIVELFAILKGGEESNE